MSTTGPGSGRPTARLVAPGYCRLTVVAGGSRVDVALPDAVPVAELLPELAELLPVDAERALHVTRIDGEPLSSERSLADQRVLAGDVLCLVAGDPPPRPLVADDVITAVAETVDARADRWRVGTVPLVAQVGGLLAILTGVVPLLLGPAGAADAVVAGVVAVALLAGLLGLRRSLPWFPAVLAMGTAALFAAVCGTDAVAAATGRPSWTATFAAAAAGGAIAAVVAVVAAPRSAAVALLSASATLAASAAALRFIGGDVAEAAAVVVLVWLWLTGLADRFALRAERLGAPAGRSPALQGHRVAEVHARTERAVGTLTGLTVGGAVAIAAGLVLLTLTDTAWAWALAGTGALAAGLRARRFRQRPQVLALAGCALAGLLALGCRLVVGVGPRPLLVVPFVALGALIAVVGALVPRVDVGPSVGIALDRLEIVVAIVLLPLVLGVFGVYGTVQTAAQTLH